MKMFATGLLFVMALLACSLPDPGCDDHSCDVKCLPTLQKHVKSLNISLDLTCPFDSVCTASLFFGVVKELGWDSQECYDSYKYTFESDSDKDVIFKFSKKMLTLSDDHLRFSLFDSKKKKKKYDIDLSSIIHSYTIDGDSVRIAMPSNLIRFSVKCPYCPDNTNDMCRNSRACVREAEYGNSTMTVGLDSSWGKYFLMSSWLDSQGPLGNDSIDISAQVYFRE